MKTGCIIQARMGSTRLPGKVMKEINGYPLLWYVIRGVRESKKVDEIIVATTGKPQDDVISSYCLESGIDFFRGSELDVLERYKECATIYGLLNVVRVTADCPLIDGTIIDDMLRQYLTGKMPGISNVIKRTFPKGYDIEIFHRETLQKAHLNSKTCYEREHVTPWMYDNKLLKSYYGRTDYSYINLCVDTPEDLERVTPFIKAKYEH